ncbi:hypothetical protein L1S32_06980 [Methanogenium sp. S4BF]|uniref:hypothetical protein n=1 Tax=Methanogenium sp. S4BF TaxID=1789226 RepID=UPI002415FBD5|nr:hypothetical protein [Methanogenium sp. S4BF]WFN33594.1 hypothetical protein L1S32_06980 [Methanogenium sp. S4BF]
MITHSKILLAGFAVTLCLFALVIFPVSADPGRQMVDSPALLEEQGIDVTEIRVAFESGDMDTVHAQPAELRDKGPVSTDEDHEIRSEGAECGRDRIGEVKREDQIAGHIATIEEQGIDVTEIRTAFALGDMDMVHALIKKLSEEGPSGDGEELSR